MKGIMSVMIIFLFFVFAFSQSFSNSAYSFADYVRQFNKQYDAS